jgi:hypothetical protein
MSDVHRFVVQLMQRLRHGETLTLDQARAISDAVGYAEDPRHLEDHLQMAREVVELEKIQVAPAPTNEAEREARVAELNQRFDFLAGHAGGAYYGWLPLLQRACRRLEVIVTGERRARLKTLGVQQKYGTLRIELNLLDSDIEAVVLAVEYLSESICEECGAAGRLREDEVGWLNTLCDLHAGAQHE